MATKSQTTILTPYQVNRYSRHIIMPQVGSVGQRKLLDPEPKTYYGKGSSH